MSKMEKERSRVRDKMSASEKALSMKKKETVNHKVPKKLRIGDSVRVLSMNLKGTVHTLPNAKGDLYVQMGILRSLVNIKDLVLIDEDASPAAKNTAVLLPENKNEQSGIRFYRNQSDWYDGRRSHCPSG